MLLNRRNVSTVLICAKLKQKCCSVVETIKTNFVLVLNSTISSSENAPSCTKHKPRCAGCAPSCLPLITRVLVVNTNRCGCSLFAQCLVYHSGWAGFGVFDSEEARHWKAYWTTYYTSLCASHMQQGVVTTHPASIHVMCVVVEVIWYGRQ